MNKLYRRTNLLLVLLVAFAGLNSVLGSLGLGDGLLNGDEPSITLSSGLSFKSVLVARDLEGESDSAVLGEVGGIGLQRVRWGFRVTEISAYQIDDAGGVLLLVGVLDEEKETLSGLAGPGDDWVRNLGLLATEVLPQVLSGNGLLAEPEVLLGEAESTADHVSRCSQYRHESIRLTSSAQAPCSRARRCEWAQQPFPPWPPLLARRPRPQSW